MSGKYWYFVCIHLIDSLVKSFRHDEEGDKNVLSVTILTTSASQQLEWIHDRMPVILEEKDVQRWMDTSNSIQDIISLMAPYENNLAWYPVSDLINNARKQGQTIECLHPLDEVLDVYETILYFLYKRC
jgi:putative SOS response-associated peptidase YedK